MHGVSLVQPAATSNTGILMQPRSMHEVRVVGEWRDGTSELTSGKNCQ